MSAFLLAISKGETLKALRHRQVLFLLFTLMACTQTQESSLVWSYNVLRDGMLVGRQQRHYLHRGDTIFESVETRKLDSVLVESYRREFIKVNEGLDIVLNEKRVPYFRLLVEDPCVTYQHPMSFDVKNCFVGFSDYKDAGTAIELVSSDEVIDGETAHVFLDSDFAVIDIVRPSGRGNFDRIIRVAEIANDSSFK